MVYLILDYNRIDNTCTFKAAVPDGMDDSVRRLLSVGYEVVSEEEFAAAKVLHHISEPEPEEPTSVWDELDAAYQEGVNGAYDE